MKGGRSAADRRFGDRTEGGCALEELPRSVYGPAARVYQVRATVPWRTMCLPPPRKTTNNVSNVANRTFTFHFEDPENDRYCIDAVPDVGPDEADPVMYLYSGRARLNQVAYNDDRDPTSLDSRICENLVRYETYLSRSA